MQDLPLFVQMVQPPDHGCRDDCNLVLSERRPGDTQNLRQHKGPALVMAERGR